ncbi:hypothetical protein BX616_001137, partial [Lobosporangium transversale]
HDHVVENRAPSQHSSNLFSTTPYPNAVNATSGTTRLTLSFQQGLTFEHVP